MGRDEAIFVSCLVRLGVMLVLIFAAPGLGDALPAGRERMWIFATDKQDSLLANIPLTGKGPREGIGTRSGEVNGRLALMSMD